VVAEEVDVAAVVDLGHAVDVDVLLQRRVTLV
jgi:hypothetical protein